MGNGQHQSPACAYAKKPQPVTQRAGCCVGCSTPSLCCSMVGVGANFGLGTATKTRGDTGRIVQSKRLDDYGWWRSGVPLASRSQLMPLRETQGTKTSICSCTPQPLSHANDDNLLLGLSIVNSSSLTGQAKSRRCLVDKLDHAWSMVLLLLTVEQASCCEKPLLLQ